MSLFVRSRAADSLRASRMGKMAIHTRMMVKLAVLQLASTLISEQCLVAIRHLGQDSGSLVVLVSVGSL